MTRAYIAPWVQLVACPSCGIERPISGRHQNFFDRAARRLCQQCAPKVFAHRATFVDGPCRPYAKRYQPDETVIDWVIVDRLTSGQQTPSTHAERVAAVAQLTVYGLPASAIAERMHITSRSVVRLRGAIRQEVSEVA